MSYIVTARKYRPQIFDDVVGQQHVTKTLKNAIISNKIAHAYIFSGGRGCGKTTTARVFAKALNCRYVESATPCNKCDVCTEITEYRSLDVIEIDGASNRGIDEVQKIREAVKYTPTKGKFRIYIIDEVHMLTVQAFNALLKTLEEPPQHVVFIFATTEIQKIPATILSRCQRYNFKRIGITEIVNQLKLIAKNEDVKIDDNSLITIAKKADGAMRDALSIFDQAIAYCGENISFDILSQAMNLIDEEYFFSFTDSIKNRDTINGLKLIEEIVNSGIDIKEFLAGLADHLRNLLIAKTSSVNLIDASENSRKKYFENVKDFAEQDILRSLKSVEDLLVATRFATQPRFKVEVAIIQLTKMEQAVSIENLLSELDDIKKKVLNSKSEPNVFANIKSPSFPDSKPKFSITLAQSEKKQNQTSETEKQNIQKPNISIDIINNKWSEFISSIRKDGKISLATVLSESNPGKLNGSSFVINTNDEFHSSTILRHKEYLAEIFFTFFSARVLFSTEIILNKKSTLPEENNKEIKKNKNDAHPIIDYLHKEFGAERV